MKYKKIKDLRRKGNKQEKTEKQVEAHRNAGIKKMIKNNPMKNPEIVKKTFGHPQRNSGRTYFKKGNTLKRFSGKKHSERTKLIIGMKNSGRKSSEKHKAIAREQMIKDNPMKNPEIVKNYKETRMKNKILRTKEKKRKNALKNENIKKSQFLPRILITDTLKDNICSLYNGNWSIQRISDEIGLSEKPVRRILLEHGIKIRNGKISKEDLSLLMTNGRRIGVGVFYNNITKKEVIK
jgi:hypothetical protein